MRSLAEIIIIMPVVASSTERGIEFEPPLRANSRPTRSATAARREQLQHAREGSTMKLSPKGRRAGAVRHEQARYGKERQPQNKLAVPAREDAQHEKRHRPGGRGSPRHLVERDTGEFLRHQRAAPGRGKAGMEVLDHADRGG
jgi:hypothetical protein